MDLRDRIEGGEWGPGVTLPPQPQLAEEYAVGLDTIRDAMLSLRAYGLIVMGQGYRARVREWPQRDVVEVEPGVPVQCRPPTEAERKALKLDDGVWVQQVGDQVYPGDAVLVCYRDSNDRNRETDPA